MKLANFLGMAAAAAVLSAGTVSRAAPPAAISKDPYIGAIVVDAATGEVLKKDDAGRTGYPASMVKLMTLFVALDAVRDGEVSLSDDVPVTREAAQEGGSQVWLDPRESFPLEELLYAMIVQSANDAAHLVAEHVAGSVPDFVARMEGKARELGLSPATRFISPNGLPPVQGLPDTSTAADFARLCVALLREHPEALAYTSVQQRHFRASSPLGFPPLEMVNTNRLLRDFPGCDGLKTGYFNRAGFSVAATAERDGRRVVAVILGSADKRVRDNVAAEWLEYGLSVLTPGPASAAVADE